MRTKVGNINANRAREVKSEMLQKHADQLRAQGKEVKTRELEKQHVRILENLERRNK